MNVELRILHLDHRKKKTWRARGKLGVPVTSMQDQSLGIFALSSAGDHPSNLVEPTSPFTTLSPIHRCGHWASRNFHRQLKCCEEKNVPWPRGQWRPPAFFIFSSLSFGPSIQPLTQSCKSHEIIPINGIPESSIFAARHLRKQQPDWKPP